VNETGKKLTSSKRQKLFWKILKVSVAMLLSMVTVVSLLIYLLMPPFYRSLQRNHIEGVLIEHESLLTETDSVRAEIQMMLDILSRSHAGFSIFDADMNLVFEHQPIDINMNVDLLLGNLDFLSEGSEFELRQIERVQENQATQPTIVYFNYETLEGHRTVQIRIPTQPLDDARDVILRVFPIASGVALIFALLISMIFSRWVVIPIKNIQKITTSMANFDSRELIPITSHDEIGELSNGINYLFEQLKMSISILEKEIKYVRDSENRKIDFLQTVSHEMKTPLASANSLIEGLRYKIPPYRDNPDYYLEECQTFLTKAITLTKESLKLAELGREEAEIFNLKSIFEQCISSYNVILLSKQISLSNEIPEDLILETNLNLFEKVLSNLYSNAIYHNNEIGMIQIRYDNGHLTIFNTCTPLEDEAINHLFEPLTMASQVDFSTGIGLYIVKQLLGQLKIPFQFTPDRDKAGMCFILELNQIIKKSEDMS